MFIINKVNFPTKIIFDCKNIDNNFTMTSKTKIFELNKLINFNNELIYFFNINPNKSIINISFEINGKIDDFKDVKNIILSDIIKNKNEEINLKIKDIMELGLKINILSKFNKKEICDIFDEKVRESIRLLTKKPQYITTGISIKDRVKMFTGTTKDNKTKDIKKQNPGKLKLPAMFENSNKNMKENKNNNNKINKDIKDVKKENKIYKENIHNEEIIKKKDDGKNINEKKIEENNLKEIKSENKSNNNNIKEIKVKEINVNQRKHENNNNEINNNEEIKKDDAFDFKIQLNFNDNISDNINNNDLDDIYEERELIEDENQIYEDIKSEEDEEKNKKEKSEEKEEQKDENNHEKENKIIGISKEQGINKEENRDINVINIEKESKEIITNSQLYENINDINESKEIITVNINSKIKEEPENKINEENTKLNNKMKSLKDIQIDKVGATISYHPKIKGNPTFKSASGDIILESQNYTSYLKSLQKKGIKESKRETFCEGFFISSFPYKNPSVIEKSHSFLAPCGHEECSKLPAMKPEIIMRYPLKDTKNLELNNVAASICFPTGIKVCYSQTNLSCIKDYVIPITNQRGERYYMVTFHFYKKYSRDEYDKKYEMHPLKHHLMRFGDAYLSLSEDELTHEKIKEIQDSLDFCQELGFRDFLYVPHCLCLISKYPYVNEMIICLRSIYKLLRTKQSINTNLEEYKYEINNLLMYLIHSVPIPEKNSLVKFFVPYYDKRIEIKYPKIEDMNIMNVNTFSLLNFFKIDHLVTIFNLILSEKKILFIDKFYDRLAKITNSFITLLYPFQWIHTYIPIMSEQMIKYLETFLPYINGIHDSLLPLVIDVLKEKDEENEEIFLVYINEDKIKLGSSLCGSKVSKNKYIQDNIPSFPSELEKKLKNKLKKIKNEINRGSKNESFKNIETIELEMRDIFIDFFIDMFHGYEKYLFLLDEQDVVFNKELFLETIPNCDKQFYNDFIDTQLFQNFTQNIIREDFNYYFNKLNQKEKEKENENKKQKKTKEKSKELKQEHNLQIKNNNNNNQILNYVVIPYYMNLKENEVRNIEILLRKKYEDEKDEIIHPIRIALNLFEIDKTKFINDFCLIYLTPEQIKAEQGIMINDNLELRKSAMPKYTGTFKVLKAKMNMKLAITNNLKESLRNESKKTEMKEYIRDIIVKIFKSKVSDIDNNMKSNFMNIIDMNFGREYFISLISLNDKLVLLKEDAFKLLGNFFYNTLLGTLKIDETDKVIEEFVILIKSSRFFGIQEKGSTTTIYDFYKKKIQNTPKIVQYNYWKKRFDLDFKYSKEKENKDEILLKKNIIFNIVSEMIDLKIIKSAIKSIIEKIINEIFGKDSDIGKDTFKIFINQISEAKYISKIKK